MKNLYFNELNSYRVYLKTKTDDFCTSKKVDALLEKIDMENKTLIFDNGLKIPYISKTMMRMHRFIETIVSEEIYNSF